MIRFSFIKSEFAIILYQWFPNYGTRRSSKWYASNLFTFTRNPTKE